MNKLTDKFVSAIFNYFFQGQTSDDDELSQAAATKQFCFKFFHFKSSSVHTRRRRRSDFESIQSSTNCILRGFNREYFSPPIFHIRQFTVMKL